MGLLENKVGDVHGMAHSRLHEWISLFEVKGSCREVAEVSWGWIFCHIGRPSGSQLSKGIFRYDGLDQQEVKAKRWTCSLRRRTAKIPVTPEDVEKIRKALQVQASKQPSGRQGVISHGSLRHAGEVQSVDSSRCLPAGTGDPGWWLLSCFSYPLGVDDLEMANIGGQEEVGTHGKSCPYPAQK